MVRHRHKTVIMDFMPQLGLKDNKIHFRLFDHGKTMGNIIYDWYGTKNMVLRTDFRAWRQRIKQGWLLYYRNQWHHSPREKKYPFQLEEEAKQKKLLQEQLNKQKEETKK